MGSASLRFHCHFQALSFLGFRKMLDVITLFTAVNIQSDLEEANLEKGENLQALVINEHDSGIEGNLIESAAEHLSSAFESFEGALSSGMTSMFCAGDATPTPPKKKAV